MYANEMPADADRYVQMNILLSTVLSSLLLVYSSAYSQYRLENRKNSRNLAPLSQKGNSNIRSTDAKYYGIWTGIGHQAWSSWTMRSTLGQKQPIIEYPSLECSGVWEPLKSSPPDISISESALRRNDARALACQMGILLLSLKNLECVSNGGAMSWVLLRRIAHLNNIYG